jgi:general secretion pathway protein D
MRLLIAVFIVSILLTVPNFAQNRLPQEYLAPDEIITLSSSMSFEQAFDILSKILEKKEGKTIIDPMHRQGQIDVEIVNLPWKKALEVILKANRLSYVEHEKYYEIVGESKPVSPEEEKIGLDSREIRIEAIFFEGDRQALKEVGIDWTALITRTNSGDTSSIAFRGASQVSDDILEGHFQYSTSDVFDKYNLEMTSMLRFFEKNDLGKILAHPQLVVLSGKEGRIQVGQDFSIKTLDFAGNVIDKFFSVGTILTVKPTVYTENNVDFIHLVIHMERSTVNPDPVSTIVNKSEANTQVLLLNGETTVLGGLYSRDNRALRRGVPWLKDLPWWVLGLRYIFGYNLNQTYDRELLVVMRASLVPKLESRTGGVPSTLHEYLKQGSQDMKDTLERNWEAKSDTTRIQRSDSLNNKDLNK